MIFGVVTDWASIKIDEFRELDVPAESNVRGNAKKSFTQWYIGLRIHLEARAI